MDDLPPKANRNLPDHFQILNNGTQKEKCPGGEVVDVEMDVGLYNGLCTKCQAKFVYLPKTDSWIREENFELDLKTNPPKTTFS